MKKITKAQVFTWVLALVPLILVAIAYSYLPACVPMHWDLGGEVGYEPKWQLWITAGIAPLMAVLFYCIPHLDPKKRNYHKFTGAYVGFQVIMMFFLIALNGICVIEGLRPGTVNVAMAVCLVVSLIVLYIGNIMPKLRMNWYCGIKNPWTLSSEAVWTRTHRIAGRMFFAAGVIGMLGAFVPNNTVRLILLLTPVIAAAVIPTVLSFLWYRAEQSGNRSGAQ
nr:SdpI family protein [uncultured Agathobaculum sp.]